LLIAAGKIFSKLGRPSTVDPKAFYHFLCPVPDNFRDQNKIAFKFNPEYQIRILGYTPAQNQAGFFAILRGKAQSRIDGSFSAFYRDRLAVEQYFPALKLA
jgi:hypothetical protein